MDRYSNLDEIRWELGQLQHKHEVLQRAFRRLAIAALGDTEDTQRLLESMDLDAVETYPDWLKGQPPTRAQRPWDE